tara:strand:- start:183 stop:581 length:399 start_codon:yes stop_codon:yes gene_type:complete
MIKQIINKLFSQTISEKDIECAIDETIVDCEHFDDDQDKAYVGVPAPILTPVDNWFSSPYGCPPVITQKQKDYMEQETIIKQQQFQETHSVESEDIHQVMYEMATKSGATTIQLDPIGGSENFQGGSENVHR